MLRYWEQIRTSFWFVPGLLALAGLSLALIMPWFEHFFPLLGLSDFAFDPGRQALAIIASGAISVTGVVFSITLVVLNMAASQLGPRLVRNFMAEGTTQWILGAFLATFIYCLIAGVNMQQHRPFQLTLLVGLLAGIFSFMLLILFIHHVSVYIQIPRVLERVGCELKAHLRALFPPLEDASMAEPSLAHQHQLKKKLMDVAAPASGYVQGIDLDQLLNLASCHGGFIRLCYRPGHYLIEGCTLARVWVREEHKSALIAGLHDAVLTGSERTAIQDPEFAVHQLVEVALRALSPGINDPYTALHCLNKLADALALLSTRQVGLTYCYDERRILRLELYPYSYGGIVDAAFQQIRQSALGNAAVVIHMVDVMHQLSQLALPEALRHTLLMQLETLHQENKSRLSPLDLAALSRRVSQVQLALRSRPEGGRLNKP
ncbi:DUF2254 domain-containing protein [Zobellella aerophila]|uniref:DUF2254 domain-containing protein n=1 Tax=Zobellella aerophila TaxID=870480 RepID=A0ABP6UZR1_9GAMM